ncbi:nucleotide exchange factor GrpE [bacterium]|nr:nucleotide exchange factor GrpE [bacterium]
MKEQQDRRLGYRLRRDRHFEAPFEVVVPQERRPRAEQAPHKDHVHKELKHHQELAAKLQDQLLRTAAEFENFRKRTRRDMQQNIESANRDLLEAVLPVLDNFGRALANPGSSVEALHDGLQMVDKQLIDTLGRFGLQKIEALGQPFDPNLHEAIATDASEEYPDNHVIEVLQDGYTLNGRLLRPAMVRVARN